ncbi:hypothetical protein CYY_008614 [Polysphondylium violaceum]|uniref:Profilin n=1 Tax=Polysphondylium violaceum TaxID=133409 RepID=A0A8J4PMS3_9MYCE|nr:hypothetical protein CYY_008614 [Polysphondylium violaceum]
MWQQYVDEQLVGTGHVEDACILGIDGITWASSNGMDLKVGEGQALAALFETPTNAFAQGITIGGVNYMGLKADERSIHGKDGAKGIVSVKTTGCIIVGRYNENQEPFNPSHIYEKLADYIVENDEKSIVCSR